MQNVLKALAPLTEMLSQKEVKIPMSDFPKDPVSNRPLE